MQRRLRGADLVVGHAAHDLVDLGEGAVDGLEYFERLFLLTSSERLMRSSATAWMSR